MKSWVRYGDWNPNDEGYWTGVPREIGDMQQGINVISGGLSKPMYAGIQKEEKVHSFLLQLQPDQTIDAQRSEIYRALHFNTDTRDNLVVERSDGTLVQKVAKATEIRRRPELGFYMHEIFFRTTEQVWKSVDAVSVTDDGPAVADTDFTLDIPMSGDDISRPIVTIEYLEPKTGQVYYTTVYTATENAGRSLTDWMMTLVIDHAALVAAGKSLAAGTDILVYVNGTQVSRTVRDPNTSTTDIIFPISLAANGTATVEIRTAPAGQTYAMETFFKAHEPYILTNRIASDLEDYPYRIQFAHNGHVSAGNSLADGSDIRVFVNGVEVERAISGANTATCSVWFPAQIVASGTSLVEIRMGGDAFGLTTFAPGSITLASSSNSEWVYVTPAIDSIGGSLPGRINVMPLQIGSFGPSGTGYNASAVTLSGNPAIRIALFESTSGGNFMVINAGGVRLVNIKTAVTYETEGNATIVRIGDSPDGVNYTSRFTFQNGTQTTSAYATRTLNSAATHVALGIEPNQAIIFSSPHVCWFHGQSANEFTVTLNSTSDTPTSAAFSSVPTVGSGTEGWVTNVSATLSDESNHELSIGGFQISQGQKIVVNAEEMYITLLNSSDVEIDGARASLHEFLGITTFDYDWLVLQPATTTTLTWSEEGLPQESVRMTVEAYDSWLG
jgi:hypothetical protein